MPIYEEAPAEVLRIRDEMLGKYHTELAEAGVEIDCLFAHSKTDKNGDQTGPALKLHGYQCAAVVKVIGLKERTKGQGDAEIVIDGDRWDEWSADEKSALIDHELEHLELCYDKDGNLKRDDQDRPKLRVRKHDHQFGWFDSIARRHGKAAFEVQQANEFVLSETAMQLYLFDDFEPKTTADKTLRSEIDSIEFSTGDKSVTVTPEQLKKAAARSTKQAAASK